MARSSPAATSRTPPIRKAPAPKPARSPPWRSRAKRRIAEILVVGDGDALCTPCGGCRQRIREFADPSTAIHIAGPEGVRASFTLAELLPEFVRARIIWACEGAQGTPMKAWLLDRLGGALELKDAPIPEPRPGGVVVRIEASALMSYLKSYVEGRLPIYNPPAGAFTPGGNAVGVVHAVGPEVYHLKPGQRVIVSSHVVADENVPEPAQFLLGITAAGAEAKALQADWRDGTLAEYALVPRRR